jgi:hypothetical protein
MPPRIAFTEPVKKRDFLSSAFSLLTIFGLWQSYIE